MRRSLEQDLAALLRIDTVAPAQRNRKLGLVIGFPLALLLGALTVSILHEEGGLAAKRGFEERVRTPSIQLSADVPAAVPSPVRKPLVHAGPSNAVVVQDVVRARPAADGQRRSKPAIRPEVGDAGVKIAVATAAAPERGNATVAGNNKELNPGKVSVDEAMVDVVKIRRVTRAETIDDIHFLKLQ